jgi:hypothetical protein
MKIKIFERIILDLSYIATIFGFIVIIYQLYKNKKMEKIKFEEEVEKEYRELIKSIPYEIFLGKIVDVSEDLNNTLYRYIDYTNSQINLRINKNISNKTWKDWQEGIIQNFSLPIINNSLEILILENYNIFKELRYLLSTKSDPKKWKNYSVKDFIKNDNDRRRRTTASTL